MSDLTHAILNYQINGQGLKQLEDEVALIIYHYPPMRHRWDPDECSEFLVYFYPRINRMIKGYTDYGKTFEMLLTVALKWQMKGFGAHQLEKKKREVLLKEKAFWDLPISDVSVNFPGDEPTEIDPKVKKLLGIDQSGKIKLNGHKKRLLYLLLRTADKVSPGLIQHSSYLTGYNTSWIEEKIEQVRLITRQRRARQQALIHRRMTALFKIYCLHGKIQGEINALDRSRLCLDLEEEMVKLKSINYKISKTIVSPTHQEIATILNTPKGSIDSGLYYLNKRINHKN